MKHLNIEQIEKIKYLEYHFNKAKNGYLKATSRNDNMLVAGILDEYNGIKTPRNFNCGHCMLKMYQEMADIYFKSLMHEQEITAELTEPINIPVKENALINENQSIKDDSKKKKAGRPKKTNKEN